jgi:hypothetical protein
VTVQNEAEAIKTLAGVGSESEQVAPNLITLETPELCIGYYGRISTGRSKGGVGIITRYVQCGQFEVRITNNALFPNTRQGFSIITLRDELELMLCHHCMQPMKEKHYCTEKKPGNCSRCGLQSPCATGCFIVGCPNKQEPKAKHAPQEMVDGLLVSTDTLHYHLIPPVALRYLTQRIMLGEEIKGKDAWNALSENQYVLDSRNALARRLGHIISHTMGLLDKIGNKQSWTEEDVKEASAVMWGGMYAICSIDRQRKKLFEADDVADAVKKVGEV